MIQFKKIPPSKSVLLLLLFLTTNVHGFLRDQNEYQVSRKTQNRYSMELQEPIDHNMPIRKIGNDRVINEKDRNAERLYDRRSFRTGTDNLQNRERSFELQRRSRVDIRDINNNRQRFTSPQDRVQNARDNRRSFESTISREYRQRSVQNREDRRSIERAVISRNRQYEESRIERDLDRVERSSERERLNVRDLNRRNNERRTTTEARSANERQEVRDRRLDARRAADRDLSQRQTEQRLTQRPSERLNDDRLTRRSLENRRSIRSVDIRDRRAPDERDFDRRLTREVPLENRDRRISERRNVDQRRLSDEDRRVSSIERSQRRSITNRDRRVSEDRQSRLAERLERANIREITSQRRAVEDRDRFSDNRNVDRSRMAVERRSIVRSDRSDSTERSVRDDRTRSVPDQIRRESRDFSRRSTPERRDQRLFERRNIRHSYEPDTRRTTERSQRNTMTSRALDANRSNFREDRFMSSRSRSDSTRYIQDNYRSRDIRLTARKDSSRLSREDRRLNENSRRETNRIADRYDPLTADSRRYFEKIVSQRATRDSVRNMEMPALGLEKNINNDTYSWASTAKVLLAAFLIGQIFVNSSKANKFRFHNIISMATSLKEKVH